MPNMFQKLRAVRMRPIDTGRLYADYRQAAGLLRHDLVWSTDFEAIRTDLANLIETQAALDNYPPNLTEIVRTLISVENDLTI